MSLALFELTGKVAIVTGSGCVSVTRRGSAPANGESRDEISG